MRKDGLGFFACSKASKRRNTLCIARFDNEATGEKGKSDCTDYFVTVPYFGTVPNIGSCAANNRVFPFVYTSLTHSITVAKPPGGLDKSAQSDTIAISAP